MFPAGVTRVSFTVSITDDFVLEGDENLSLIIDPSSLPNGVGIINLGQATVTIVDDDGM